MHFGLLLKEYLRHHNLKIADLSKLLKLKEKQIQQILAGKQLPEPREAARIQKILQIVPRYFYEVYLNSVAEEVGTELNLRLEDYADKLLEIKAGEKFSRQLKKPSIPHEYLLASDKIGGPHSLNNSGLTAAWVLYFSLQKDASSDREPGAAEVKDFCARSGLAKKRVQEIFNQKSQALPTLSEAWSIYCSINYFHKNMFLRSYLTRILDELKLPYYLREELGASEAALLRRLY